MSVINNTFSKAKSLIPDDQYLAHEWLSDLESDANNNLFPDWLNTVRGFMRGLWASKVIDIAEIDDFDKYLESKGLI
jgi:hypothetical protein